MSQEKEHISIKGLTLASPEYARTCGLVVQESVFISQSDSLDMKPLTYQVGAINEVLVFDPTNTEADAVIKSLSFPDSIGVQYRPQFRLGYFETLLTTRATSDDVSYFVSGWGLGKWVAVVEPLGRIKVDEDPQLYFNRSTDRLKVRKILAFCQSCNTQLENGGLVVDINRRGRLYPACGLEMHGEEITSKKWPYFRFTFDQDNKVIFEYKNL